jgi:hypothetical protein
MGLATFSADHLTFVSASHTEPAVIAGESGMADETKSTSTLGAILGFIMSHSNLLLGSEFTSDWLPKHPTLLMAGRLNISR